ncbi:unnamed protein product [Rotaria sp. Silwood2]|nr:unnamed protein product [Rotaria sp. Silwood2]
MPRNCCQHPTRHAMSTSKPKELRAVSSKLSMFLTSRYNIIDTRIHWLCPRCHTLESKEMNNQTMDMDTDRSDNDDGSMTEDTASDENDNDLEGENNGYINEEIEGAPEDSDDETDSESMDEEPGDVSFDLEYRQNEAMEKLSTVFRLFNIDPIHDKIAVSPIRAKVDEIYRHLHGLCDVLQGKAQGTHNASPHNLLISESNELLDGLKKLFDESDDIERVRLMTIAPKNWGRKKLERW